MNSPVNKTNRFSHGFFVSDSVEITSIRVYILKQLFTSGSVNIVITILGTLSKDDELDDDDE